jgi:hypothetical protein
MTKFLSTQSALINNTEVSSNVQLTKGHVETSGNGIIGGVETIGKSNKTRRPMSGKLVIIHNIAIRSCCEDTDIPPQQIGIVCAYA